MLTCMSCSCILDTNVLLVYHLQIFSPIQTYGNYLFFVHFYPTSSFLA